MTRSAAALRFSLFYGTIFSVLGVYGPFWPLWLNSRGLSAENIGVILAFGLVLKTLIVPYISRLADLGGNRNAIATLLAFGGICTFSLFHFTQGFWPILLLSLVYSGLWAAVMPLGESITVLESKRYHLPYGRLRLWGSASFILGSVGGGWLLTGKNEDLIYWAVLACLVLTGIATLLLPKPASLQKTNTHSVFLPLLKDRPFMTCIVAATLIQASHTVYYAFSTLYWRQSGHSETTIGLLWGEGVLAEIVLFAFGSAFIKQTAPGKLLLLAALAAILRWSLLANFTSLEVLVFAQVLHALTFGITHLAIIDYVTRRVPETSTASAMGIYTATAFGVGSGLAMLAAGYLYEALAGKAFSVMALIGLAAALVAGTLLSVNRSQPTPM